MQNPHNENIFADDVCGTLLAGGQSRRMEQDKAQLRPTPYGEPLAERGLRTLQAVCAEVFVAGDRPDLARPGVACHPDLQPGSSLAGLHNALSHASRDWVLVLPCDLPFPSPNLLWALLAARRDGALAVVPRTEHGSEPLIACYHRNALPLAERALADGELRLRKLVEQLQPVYLEQDRLPPGWRRALTNLNTPDDLQRHLAPPPAITFVAKSGTGKTTLVEKVIAELFARGWTIGALKHDAHHFEVDKPGKDTWRMTGAGATLTGICSPEKSALIRQHELEPTLDELLAPYVGQVDIIITEGFKRSTLPKIEVHRAELQQPLLCRGAFDDPALIAVASDVYLELDVPLLPLNDAAAVVDFLEQRFLK